MKVISYEDWRARVQKAHENDEIEGCDECEGTGEVVCEYGHFHDCPECNGDGSFAGVDTTRRAYALALAADLQALLDWCGAIPPEVETTSGVGMVVYSDIETRKLRIVA